MAVPPAAQKTIARLAVGACAALVLAARPAAAVEAFDGRVEVHGFEGEVEVRSV